MANLGTLTTPQNLPLPLQRWQAMLGVFPQYSGMPPTRRYSTLSHVRRLPVFFEGSGAINTFTMATDKAITGTVTLNGSPLANCLVRLYHRASGQPVDLAWTAGDGSYSFQNLYGAAAAYFVVAFDPDGGTQYNAVLHDRLTPV